MLGQPPYRVRLCKFYREGYCKHGDRCTYAHCESSRPAERAEAD